MPGEEVTIVSVSVSNFYNSFITCAAYGCVSISLYVPYSHEFPNCR